jgi:transcriptional accessory protein Tex/SPT6
VYRLGDKVRVQIVRVDMERRQVELGLVDILDTVRQDERRRGVPRSRTKLKKEARREEKREERRARKRKQRPGRRERATRKKG